MPTVVEYFQATVRLGNILNGDCQNDLQRRIYNRFWAVFSREIFRKMHSSYKRRSRKHPDDYPAWEPLKPKTIRRKRYRKKPPPSQHPTWINYDTGKLLKSYSPGKISNDTYVPPKNQLWSIKPGKLELGTLVKYAEKVSARRDLFPRTEVLVRWCKEASEVAVKSILPLLGAGGKVWPNQYPGYWPFRNTRGQFSRIG
jgi:hypothetical protein